MKERETIINIDSCMVDSSINQEINSLDDKTENLHSFKISGMPMMSVDVLANGVEVGGASPDSVEKARKERRMSMSAKKPPKPPRPPRGLSLDASDQKLIKEISELLVLKRARIERMKALKKTRAAKGMSNSSSSSSGNFIAMLFTLLFCVVIIFQGCHPWGMFVSNSPISSKADGSREGKSNLSSNGVHMLSSKVGSSNVLVSGSDNKGGGGEAMR